MAGPVRNCLWGPPKHRAWGSHPDLPTAGVALSAGLNWGYASCLVLCAPGCSEDRAFWHQSKGKRECGGEWRGREKWYSGETGFSGGLRQKGRSDGGCRGSGGKSPNLGWDWSCSCSSCLPPAASHSILRQWSHPLAY